MIYSAFVGIHMDVYAKMHGTQNFKVLDMYNKPRFVRIYGKIYDYSYIEQSNYCFCGDLKSVSFVTELSSARRGRKFMLENR